MHTRTSIGSACRASPATLPRCAIWAYPGPSTTVKGFVRQGSQLIGEIRGRVFTSGIIARIENLARIENPIFCHALQRTTEVRRATQAAQTKLRSPELV